MLQAVVHPAYTQKVLDRTVLRDEVLRDRLMLRQLFDMRKNDVLVDSDVDQMQRGLALKEVPYVLLVLGERC